MSYRGSDIALGWIETAGRARTLESLRGHLHEVREAFAFNDFVILDYAVDREAADSCFLIDEWRPGWIDHYVNRQHGRRDPVSRRLAAATTPVLWAAPYAPWCSDAEVAVMHEAEDFGTTAGVAIPVGPAVSGKRASVCFGTAQRRVDLSPADLQALQLISAVAYVRAREIRSIEATARDLSRREIECLRWVASGKTAWETSQILGLSERTVEKYLCSAMSKLDAINRVQAVAHAFRFGLIQ
jgi:LuxR family quorum sensing-dependent transcriptional regulator